MFKNRSGFTLIEVIVVVFLTSILFTVTLIGFNRMNASVKKDQIKKAEEEVASAIVHIAMSGTPIADGNYTVDSFFNAYKVTIPHNPMTKLDEKTGEPVLPNRNEWHIYYSLADKSYVIETVNENGEEGFRFLVSTLYPFLPSPTSPMPEEGSSSELFLSSPEKESYLESNILYNGSFEKRIAGWRYGGSFNSDEILLSSNKIDGHQSLEISFAGPGVRTLTQEKSVTGTKFDRYQIFCHFNSFDLIPPGDIANIKVCVELFYKVGDKEESLLTWYPSVTSLGIWQDNWEGQWATYNNVSNAVGTVYDTIGVKVTITNNSSSSYSCLLDDFRLYLLQGGE